MFSLDRVSCKSGPMLSLVCVNLDEKARGWKVLQFGTVGPVQTHDKEYALPYTDVLMIGES